LISYYYKIIISAFAFGQQALLEAEVALTSEIVAETTALALVINCSAFLQFI
jgi:hypothetical protein